MRKLLEECPACGGELVVSQQSCVDCDVTINGQFQPNIFSKLSPDGLLFIEVFVRNKGNVKEMERALGWSYWTIRNRLNEIIAELGFEDDRHEIEENNNASHERQAVLAQLDRGEIDVNDAADLLSKLRPS